MATEIKDVNFDRIRLDMHTLLVRALESQDYLNAAYVDQVMLELRKIMDLFPVINPFNQVNFVEWVAKEILSWQRQGVMAVKTRTYWQAARVMASIAACNFCLTYLTFGPEDYFKKAIEAAVKESKPKNGGSHA